MRSFDIVDYKIDEAEFFLKKLSRCKNMYTIRYLFSAYVSALRSVTFCLQASLSEVNGFKEWYKTKQEILINDLYSKFFVEARNLTQKVGITPITNGSYSNGKILFYFGDHSKEFLATIPEEDVVSVSKRQFKIILGIVYDCYIDFGTIIDPHQYYTKANYDKLGKTIDDLDEYMMGIRGYSYTPEWPEAYRWQLYRNHEPGCGISHLFWKYLKLLKPHPPLLPDDPKEFDGKEWVPPCLQNINSQ